MPPHKSVPLTPEQLAALRAGLRVRETVAVSTVDLVAEQARASARVAEREKAAATAPRSIGQKLPLAARIATAHPDRMINMPVCEADLPKYEGRPFNKQAWLAALERALLVHDFDHVHHATVILACRELADAAESGRGMAQWTYELWAKFARCCRSTIHKIIRALWDMELVRIANPFYWVGRDQRRAANVYFPTVPPGDAPKAIAESPASPEASAPAEAAAPVGARKAMDRMAAAVRELLPCFPGLAARVFGMNTSPLRQERRAAPA